MTTTVNPTLTEAEIIFKSLIWDSLLQAAESEVPFLSLPVIKQVVQLISDFIYSEIVLFVDITTIRLLDQQHQSAYERASEQLVIVAQEKGTNSNEFKTAQAQALLALSRFTHFSA
jgi:hypothetical protein